MDPLGIVIGVLGVLAAIVVPIIVSRLERRKKSLAYEILANTSLISIRDEIKDELQILFRGKPAESLHLILVKIINNGNVPIVPTDHIRPLSLSLGGMAEIHAVEVIESHPEKLEASVQVNENEIVLEPLLLNNGDWITLKVLATGLTDTPHVSARIIGVQSVRRVSSSNVIRVGVPMRLIRFVLVFITFSYLAWQYFPSLGITLDPVSFLVGIVVAGITGGVLFLISDWWSSVTRPYTPSQTRDH
jgi:hypothetical protein